MRPGLRWLAGFVSFLLFVSISQGASPSTPFLTSSNHAFQSYSEARTAARKEPKNATAAGWFALKCFYYADFSATKEQRETLALEGMEVAKKAVELDTSSAMAHYTLALNLGQLARTRTLSAIGMVQVMEKEFLNAIKLDGSIDHAGPHRALGTLYRDAPGWPVSVGNDKKAESQLKKALKLSPSYPGNTLAYLEVLVEMEDEKKICQLLPSSRKILKEARKNLAGEAWASSWEEWEDRLNVIQEKVPCP